jgi:ribosome-associated translation inhibitor RaiA
MVKVIFKNLEKSDLIRKIAAEKVEKALQKYAVVDPLASTVILSREHSREHSGLDEYSVKLMVGARGHKPVIVEKRSTSMMVALATVLDRAMDLLHQSLAKERLGVRHERRRWKTYQRWKQSFATWNQTG